MADVNKVLRELIAKIAIEQGFSHYDIEIKPISSGGANYTSALFLITITGNKDDLKLFAKVATMGEKIRKSTSLKAFDTERFFYTTLANIYREIEEKHNLPVEHRICIPKYYGNNSNYLEETIVLEDLVNEGYSVYDRTISMDWAYASKAVEEIAKLHALSHAFAKSKPEQFENAIQTLKYTFDMSGEQQKMFFDRSFKSALEAAMDSDKENLMKFMTNFNQNALQKYLAPTKCTVLKHGDYRISNQMYKRNKDGSVNIINLDFQTMQGGSPVTDLLYLIFTGTDEEFRRQHYHKLLDYYYEQFYAALKRLDLDPDDVYTRDDFDQELKEKLTFGLLVAIVTLPIVTVEAEHAPVMDENADVSSLYVAEVSNMYHERMRGVINDYVSWGAI